MYEEKKEYVAPKYKMVDIDAENVIGTNTGDDCYEMHGFETGTDCHDHEIYTPET